jgi:Rrf2 family iron-sulfur cluster assembly transcriptional regulator
LWCDLSDQIHNFLSGISLSDLVERGDVQSVSARQNARSEQGATLSLAEI